MVTHTHARRLVQGLLALATWAAAVAAVMWFYDWVSRWYVVVAILLLVVTGAVLVEAAGRQGERGADLPSS